MDPAKIIYCLSNIVNVNLNDNTIDKLLQEDREVAQYLAEIITSLCNRKQFEYAEETTLDLYYDQYDYEGDECEEEDDESESDSDYDIENDVNEKYPNLGNYSIEFMQQVVDYADEKDESGKCRRTWKSIHHRFRTLPNQSYVSRFRKYIENNGTRNHKLQEIDKVVYQKLIEAHERYLPIHDIDLQRWAFKVSRELGFDDFQASEFWIRTFKNRHKLRSRKITNIITKREMLNSNEIIKSEEHFIKLFNQLSPKYKEAKIFITDQVGIEKEQYSTRTLSFQGERKTFSVVKSKHATTHSYAVQPTISLDGQLIGPTYLCLQEPSGKMGKGLKRIYFNLVM